MILVAATIASWSGLVVAHTETRVCTRSALPSSALEPVAFSGSRVAYASNGGGFAVWYGTLGRLRNARVRAPSTPPVWAGSRVAYGSGRLIRFVGGGSLAPALPAGAQIVELAAHGSRFALTAQSGDGKQGTLRAALFVVTTGSTRKLEDEPEPYGERPAPVWSPDGSRIAYARGGDVWTIRPDGTGATRLSHTPRATEGGPVWSPDSKRVAYWSRNRNAVIETYSAPAAGGPETRLTHTKPMPPGIPQAGTQPLAWHDDRIAVRSFNAIGTVGSAGGAVEVICRLRPAASTYFGSGSWP
jgi:hypothetical protein